jgi:hypothetical protein
LQKNWTITTATVPGRERFGTAWGRQSDIGNNTSRSLEARRIVDRRLEAQCGDQAETRCGHEPADLHIMTHQLF